MSLLNNLFNRLFNHILTILIINFLTYWLKQQWIRAVNQLFRQLGEIEITLIIVFSAVE
ncbi:hypothetical protein HMPREF9373_0244 [Psychrobacter sp. 1501(2011)]|nr:hypothetical protein HMPREF9373_0244 [Psychrobacter sp. 1501(2011)]